MRDVPHPAEHPHPGGRAPSRRRALGLLAGGAAVVAVGAAAGWRALGPADQSPPVPLPSTPPGPRESGSFASRACGRNVAWQLALPPGRTAGGGLPVALVLHGRGGSAAAAFDGLALDGYLANVVAGGAPPFALAAVDGGDHGYWHRRASGEDAQSMLLDEYLPLLATRGLRTERVGAFGWSMGGYGALLLAQTTGPDRVVAVAASSPALWSRAADTAEGAFDDAEDFAAETHAFAPAVPDLAGTDFGPGAHDRAYWRSTAPDQLRFLGSALAGA